MAVFYKPQSADEVEESQLVAQLLSVVWKPHCGVLILFVSHPIRRNGKINNPVVENKANWVFRATERGFVAELYCSAFLNGSEDLYVTLLMLKKAKISPVGRHE